MKNMYKLILASFAFSASAYSATYYVDPVSGSDAAAGTSFATAWATTQHAADTAVAGDEVRLCKTGTESISATLDFDTNSGTVSAPITFVSYDSTGTSQEDGYHIQVASSISILQDLISDWLRFVGIDFDGNGNVTSTCVDASGSGEGENTIYIRCTLRDCDGHGSNIRGGFISFIGCNIHSMGLCGLRPQSTASSRWSSGLILGNRIHGNGDAGIGDMGGNSLRIIGNLIYGNLGDGIEFTAAIQFVNDIIIGNTIFGNLGDAIDLSTLTEYDCAVYDNTLVSNGGYAIRMGTASPGRYIDHNHTHDNTSGATDYNSGTLPGVANQTGDPLFTNTTQGSEDFKPLSGSPLIGNGLLGGNIGAVAADAGGGNTLRHTAY